MRHFIVFGLACWLAAASSNAGEPKRPAPAADGSFAFVYMTDLHTYLPGTPETSLKNSCARLLADGAGSFLITGGDYDNYPETERYLEKYLLGPLRERGVDYPWYTVVGNHDAEGTANEPKRNNDRTGRNIKRIILRNRRQPNLVNHGPAERSKLIDYGADGAKDTTFSFDYGDCHFVLLDLYSAQTPDRAGRGQADAALVDWVADDLKQTRQARIFVFAHEPIVEFSGIAKPGAAREPIDPKWLMTGERERLWSVLKADKRVVAFVDGHNHSFGLTRDGTLWQVSASHEWAGMRMVMKFLVAPESVVVRVYTWRGDRYGHDDFLLWSQDGRADDPDAFLEKTRKATESKPEATASFFGTRARRRAG